jgi:glycine betaine/proline transport system substrate-binding protein
MDGAVTDDAARPPSPRADRGGDHPMRHPRLARLLVAATALSLVLGACARQGGSSTAPSTPGPTGSAAAGGSTEPSTGAKPGVGKTVNIAVNPWVGYEADAAVIGYLLENELGYKVEKKNLAEQVSWEGFPTGDVDVILENWGHDDLKKKYIDTDKTAVSAGDLGVTGIIGWYVPAWMKVDHPDIDNWENLNKYADLFKTSESGGKGQLLDGDPSYVTNDVALVKNLKLNYEVVVGGTEAALITSFQTATTQKKPLLAYFYDPQWALSQPPLSDQPLVRIKLPEYKAGCDAKPEEVACDYPPYTLDKIVSTKFSTDGGAAFTLVKNFKWTNLDQSTVSELIANKGMTPEEAGAKWVTDNPDKWKAWMP